MTTEPGHGVGSNDGPVPPGREPPITWLLGLPASIDESLPPNSLLLEPE